MLSGRQRLKSYLNIAREKRSTIPLFIRESDGNLIIIPADHEDLDIAPGSSLIYLGEEIEMEEE